MFDVRNIIMYLSLHSGSFGRVRLVKRKATGKFSCVKVMRKEELIKSQQVDHIANEYRILSSINHPFIVPFMTRRSTSKDSPRIVGVSTCFWSMSPVASCSRI
jgi:serine/threonine protein kinase